MRALARADPASPDYARKGTAAPGKPIPFFYNAAEGNASGNAKAEGEAKAAAPAKKEAGAADAGKGKPPAAKEEKGKPAAATTTGAAKGAAPAKRGDNKELADLNDFLATRSYIQGCVAARCRRACMAPAFTAGGCAQTPTVCCGPRQGQQGRPGSGRRRVPTRGPVAHAHFGAQSVGRAAQVMCAPACNAESVNCARA
jgi:hypothetical protein